MVKTNRYLTKLGKVYYHVTSENNIDNILREKKIMSIGKIALNSPERLVEVEPTVNPLNRTLVNAATAAASMSGIKDISKVFLTEGKYLPEYGEFVIRKKVDNLPKRVSLNTIPGEHTAEEVGIHPKDIVYVPRRVLARYQKNYPELDVRSTSKLKSKKVTINDRVYNYPGKVKDYLLHKIAELNPKKLHRSAIITGSSGLGIGVKSSDVDIFIPVIREKTLNKVIERIKVMHPELLENGFSDKKSNKRVLTGVIDGKEYDVVVGSGSKAEAFKQAFEKAKASLSEEDKEEIKRLKSGFQPKWYNDDANAYKGFKYSVADNLGLTRAYF